MISPATDIIRLEEESFLNRSEESSWVVQDEKGKRWSGAELSSRLEGFPDEVLSGHRMATLISDSLVSALVSLKVMTGGSCLPLNPQWTEGEVRKVLEELEVAILVVEEGSSWGSIFEEEFAVFRVKAGDSGLEWLGPEVNSSPVNDPFSLVLLTSGSTGRPKAVPLTAGQILAACDSIAGTLELGEADCCLNFLPMMHIGGLLDQFLAPLKAGGRVVFTSGDEPEVTARLVSENEVTWIQGAPAMLQHLLRAQSLPKGQLRFIRSVSAPLSNELLGELEARFESPVIEIYGMSETTGVITSNPLPPAKRKVGSVGIPQDIALEIRNVDESQPHSSGEVWVKGERVFDNYWRQPKEAASWDGEWFFTGDQGYLDEEGYLFLTGRTKEFINRGGQKFSPLEIDHLVSSWSEVSEAAAFAFSHATLGEEVGLAVVLEEGASLEKEEVGARLREELAPYKIPRRVCPLESLPRNENGKLQRHLLAELCEAKGDALVEEKLSPLQERIARLWEVNLKVSSPPLDQDYFEAGGDSLSMTALILSLEKEFETSLTALSFFDHTTIRSQAEALSQLPEVTVEEEVEREHVLPEELARSIAGSLQSWEGELAFPGAYTILSRNKVEERPFLFVWCGNGQSEWKAINDAVGEDFRLAGMRTLYFLQKRKKRDLELLSRAYVEDLKKIHPTGRFVLGGFCAGAKIMELVAQRLREQGREVQVFFSHDYIPEHPPEGRLALICSGNWHRDPFRRFPELGQGWTRLMGSRWGHLNAAGLHGSYEDPEFARGLGVFIREQLSLSETEEKSDPSGALRPEYDLEVVGRLPRVMKAGQVYAVIFRVTNKGAEALPAGQGLALQARWNSSSGKVRVQEPMRSELPRALESGASVEMELPIVAQKRHRLERLEVALLEEGLDWFFIDYEPSFTLNHWAGIL